MKRIRRIVQWTFLVLTGLLAVLSVVGAFLGDERARVLFNSVPLVVYWFVLAALFIAGVLFFKNLRRSPGLAAMHVGTLLILGGAMWGSDQGHALAKEFFGGRKFPSGYMRIVQGETTNQVFADTSFSPDTAIAKLPFSVHLARFGVEYYPAEQEAWDLFVVAPCPECAQKGHAEGESQQARISWTVGQTIDVPLTKARLQVLQYLPNARPSYSGIAKPTLEITLPDGKKESLPAEVGRQAAFENPKVTVRIVQCIANFEMKGMGAAREIIDRGGPPVNPALKVELESADGQKRYRYIMPQMPMHGKGPEELNLAYRFPEPTGAEPDPRRETPAMEVLLRSDSRQQREWFMPGPREAFQWISLAPVLGMEEKPVADDEAITVPRLYLAKPVGQIKDYKSDLLVVDEGQEVDRKVIEVNDPLHYGGYHFYQHGYDSKAGQYTILSVHSDSGLWAVYLGFILLVAGAFVRSWAEPVVRRLTERKRNGD